MTAHAVELTPGPQSSEELAAGNDRTLPGPESLRPPVKETPLAEPVRLPAVSLGEHYLEPQIDSATPRFPATAARATSTSSLGTSVVVLSTHDPVRPYLQFATAGRLASGRGSSCAEVRTANQPAPQLPANPPLPTGA